jgi:hypothetical protein
MWPLRFVMPHDPSMRPVWMIRAGLFLYDHLAKRECAAGSHHGGPAPHAAGAPLKPQFTKGFVYSDGWVDDARLVVLNAVDAAARGATVLTRTPASTPKCGADGWQATLQPARAASAHRRERTRPGQCRRPLGGAVPRDHGASLPARVAAPGQGQPHRGARSCLTTTTPTSSRTPTSASSSPSPTRATSR